MWGGGLRAVRDLRERCAELQLLVSPTADLQRQKATQDRAHLTELAECLAGAGPWGGGLGVVLYRVGGFAQLQTKDFSPVGFGPLKFISFAVFFLLQVLGRKAQQFWSFVSDFAFYGFPNLLCTPFLLPRLHPPGEWNGPTSS